MKLTKAEQERLESARESGRQRVAELDLTAVELLARRPMGEFMRVAVIGGPGGRGELGTFGVRDLVLLLVERCRADERTIALLAATLERACDEQIEADKAVGGVDGAVSQLDADR